VSEWLDLMLEEIARKQRESKEAEDELQRREDAQSSSTKAKTAQSK
jgi:hypothetical protein